MNYQTGHSCPDTPKEWIVDCQAVGRGLPALKYLSRYLYRGVISDRQIVNDDGHHSPGKGLWLPAWQRQAVVTPVANDFKHHIASA